MIVTCKEMKEIEKRADENGLSYYQMMENAGTSAFQYISEKNPKSVSIFCGKGNNGGDGFVVARLLKEQGVDVAVYLVDGEPGTQDAITNYNLIKDNVSFPDCYKEADIIVDAIYGTGFHGELRENAREAVSFINNSGAYVFSLDIPSGLSGDALAGDPNPVRADCTVAFHALKPIHVSEEAKPYLGKVVIGNIGI